MPYHETKINELASFFESRQNKMVMTTISIINPNQRTIGEDVLGVVDYYQAIFERRGLTERESEFRMSKLGLIVDLIKTTEMPDDLASDLVSTIISAWRLSIPGRTIEDMTDEKYTILGSTEAIRSAVLWARDNQSPVIKKQLDATIQFSLPMKPIDLREEDVQKVHDLLNDAMEYIADSMESERAPAPSLP